MKPKSQYVKMLKVFSIINLPKLKFKAHFKECNVTGPHLHSHFLGKENFLLQSWGDFSLNIFPRFVFLFCKWNETQKISQKRGQNVKKSSGEGVKILCSYPKIRHSFKIWEHISTLIYGGGGRAKISDSTVRYIKISRLREMW
jgi:hypothetical protein